MNYIGSKLSLLDFINDVIETKVEKKDNLVFCDIFSGTAIVGQYFKNKGYSIISNEPSNVALSGLEDYSYYDIKIISMQITLKNLKKKLHKQSAYYKKKYHDLIKTMDLTKFNKEELEILKKAFGNNLNIGYLNTLSNTEEEKFITLINKYNFEEEKTNSKLNEKIKELAKDIPINYRLTLDLYLGFYDGKKYTVDELSLILNLPAYEIKTRIKNGIIYIKNILNTKDLESQKELNTLIKSL